MNRHRYLIVLFFFLPAAAMFVLPALLYQWPLSIRTFEHGVVRFEVADGLRALLVVLVWSAIILVVALWPRREERGQSLPGCEAWDSPGMRRLFWTLSLGGVPVAAAARLLVLPGGMGVLFHILSLAPALGAGLGAVLLAKGDVRPRVWLWVVVLADVLVAFVLPLALGTAWPPVVAGAVMLYALAVARARAAVYVSALVAIAVFGIVALTVKYHIRQAWFGGHAFSGVPVCVLWDADCRGSDRPVAAPRRDAAEACRDSSGFRSTSYQNYDPNYYRIRLVPRAKSMESVRYTVSRVWHRVSALEDLTYVMVKTPATIPYAEGKTYKPLLFALIPRALWPGKPTAHTGQWFGHRYGYLNPCDKHTAVNLNVVSEAWINGGWLVVVLTAVGLGLVLRLVGWIMGRLPSGPERLVIGMVAVASLLATESGLFAVAGGLGQHLVVYLALLWGLRRVSAAGPEASTG